MQPVVAVDVVVCRTLPRVVSPHSLGLQLPPCLLVGPEDLAGIQHRVCHLVGVHVGEREARSLARVLVVRDDGVAESSRLAHHRQRAVSHGDHLRQAARLELRRHQQKVAARIHAVAEGVVKGDARAHLVAVDGIEVAERVFLVGVARTEDRHLHAALHELAHGVADEAEALLVGQATDHDDERTRRILGQTQLLLQRALVLRLLVQRRDVVVRRDELVGGRIPQVVVDAVQDAHQGLGTTAEDGIHALAVEGHLQLVGIRRADRGDQIAVAERALHVVDGVAVAVELIDRRWHVAEAKHVREDPVRILALELDVVDREHGLDVVAGLALAIELAQEDGRHGGLPVVAVQHVARKLLELADALADGLGEERIALAVVEVAVDAVALEVRLVVDEVEVDALVLEVLDAAVDVAPRKGHIEVRHVLHLLLVLPRDGGVLGHDDGNLSPRRLECLGERPRDIAQTAGLDERHSLGCGEQDANLSPHSICHVVPRLLWWW